MTMNCRHPNQPPPLAHHAPTTHRGRFNAWIATLVLTAMSGLSARTYSWGGDAWRFWRAGGSSSSVGELARALDRNCSMPSFPRVGMIDSSSVVGADDSAEESEEDMESLFRELRRVGVAWGAGGCVES